MKWHIVRGGDVMMLLRCGVWQSFGLRKWDEGASFFQFLLVALRHRCRLRPTEFLGLRVCTGRHTQERRLPPFEFGHLAYRAIFIGPCIVSLNASVLELSLERAQ